MAFLVAVFWRGVAFFACSVLEGCAFLEGAFSVMEGCGIFGECFGECDILGGVRHFWRCLQCFGGVWHFWRALVVFACSVLEVRDILEEELPVFWRGVVFLEGACRGGIFEGCLQYFGGT